MGILEYDLILGDVIGSKGGFDSITIYIDQFDSNVIKRSKLGLLVEI
jgi:hypothetical protein